MSKRRRINLRQTARVSYYEPDEPSLDEYVFCSECGDYVYEYCSIHGPLLVIPDDKVPINPDVPSFVPRAALTIPHVFLHLNYSSIPGAGLGVFATLTLPRGVRFGPYRGSKSNTIKSSYCWQIRDASNRPCHVVDASDPHSSNWMRFVNCSRHWREQNLVAYQYRGQIYYRTIKIIPRFTELLVFYGSEFACELGIDLKKYNSPGTYAQKLGTQKPTIEEIEATIKATICTETTHTETKKQSDSSKNIDIKEKEKGKEVSNNTVINVNENTKHVNENAKALGKGRRNFESDALPLIDKSNDICVESSDLSIDFNNNNCVIKKVCEIEPSSDINVNYSPVTKKNKYNRTIITKYTCDICAFVTRRKESLENHLLLHGNVKGIKYFKCKFCLHVSKTESDIKRHELSHTGEKPYTCDVCQRKFTKSGNLATHKRIHTGEKPYTCDMCQRKFCQSNTLTSHKRTHTGEKPYTCDVCQRKFTESGHLAVHKRIHNGEKPYTCDVCQRKFTTSSHLVTHKRIHTGEKPYTCDVCQCKFTKSCNLAVHKRIHTGEKPYTCDVCQRKFTDRSNLASHKRIHTGDKPYTCDVCQCKFTKSCNLASHKRIHTGEKP